MRVIWSMKTNWRVEETGLAVKWPETWNFRSWSSRYVLKTTVELPFSLHIFGKYWMRNWGKRWLLANQCRGANPNSFLGNISRFIQKLLNKFMLTCRLSVKPAVTELHVDVVFLESAFWSEASVSGLKSLVLLLNCQAKTSFTSLNLKF